ncbi:ABC transporter substrate-binding protein [Streptomyces sp. NPDC052042]|uniref:ABC transporter substrate-binding protein n=1 Tax=Streptomyces sp. NPDC052042 TaxID=3365683 RepID=UPI0037D49D52
MIKTNHRKAGILATAVAVALLAAGCGGGEPGTSRPTTEVTKSEGVSLNAYGGAKLALGQPMKGGSLKAGVIAPIDSLDPTVALPTPGTSAAMAVYDTLMKIEPDGQAAPEMAESLTSTDNVHWTLKLRPGVTFTDGTPYDADAVIAHLKRYASPESQARDAGQARQITSLKKANDLTVELTVATKSVEFPLLLAGSAGMVPSPSEVRKAGKSFGLHPVGAGPFKVKSFQPGGDLVLERNPGYRDKNLPYLDRLTLTTATDTQARLSALKAGSLDLAPTQSVTDFKEAEKAGLTVLEQPAYTYFYIALNLSKPPFNDPNMRKALLEGIDTQALAKAVFEGQQPPMKGWFTSNHPEFTKTAYPAYDPDHAKKLVDAYRAGGKSPDFTMTITSPPEFQRQASVIQQMLSDIGIKMSIGVSDQPTIITEAAAGNYVAQLRFIGMTLQTTTDLSIRFLSTSPGSITKSGDPELDSIIKRLNVTPMDQRHDLYTQAQQKLTGWMPSIPLVQQVGGWIVGKQVGGFPGAQGEQTVDMFDARHLYAK